MPSIGISIAMGITGSYQSAQVSEPGYDVIVLAGQSNMVGRNGPVDPVLDATDSDIFMYGYDSQTVVIASDPLDQRDETANTVGPGLSFAKAYKAGRLASGRQVLLVPVADGGTSFGSGFWQVGGSGHDQAIARTNAAMTQGSGTNRLVAILWHQGESDRTATQAQYETWLFELIASFRANMTGAGASTPFIVGEISDSSTQWGAGVDAALENLTSVMPYTGFVETDDLALGGDSLHFTAASCRTLGARYYGQLTNAEANDINPGYESATRHWLLGDDNTSNIDGIAAAALTDDSASGPTYEMGYATLPNQNPNGLRSSFSDALDTYTLCAVVRTPSSSNAILMGNLGQSGTTGGISAYQQDGNGVRVNARGNEVATLSAYTSEYMFVAISIDVSNTSRLDYFNGVGAVPSNQGTILSSPARNFAIGNSHYSSGFNASIEASEFIIFSTNLTELQLDDVYARSKIRMAARGVRLA